MEREPFFARSLTLVPRSLLRNRMETLATQATSSPNGELPRMLPNKSILPFRRSVFIGLPARATPNREMSRVRSRLRLPVASMLKKGQNGGRSPQRVPSPLQWGRLLRVISDLLADRFRSRFGTNTSLTYCVELLALYLRGMII